MRNPLSVLLVAGLILSGCGFGESRFNPVNWFGGSEPVEAEAAGEVNPLIPSSGARGMFARPDPVDRSVPVPVVTELAVERIPTGAIVRATGTAARLGPYGAWLRRETSEEEAAAEGVIEFSFRVTYPNKDTPVGTEHARRVVVAESLSTGDLEGVRVIRVLGAQNALESRRR
ncbi:MAG TPA: hypothetical protein DEA05_05430 [Rhodobacteraceae bacterium]|nr:hypothetical protein [Paracoccaceae bacterium]